jgi:AcrR family transcriptional regulator
MKKTDPRVVRTRQMLRDALVATIIEQGYDAANIQNITERAGLRRATFYLHYRDKEDLLLSMLAETTDALMQEMEAQTGDLLTAEAQYAQELMTFQHVQTRADLYRAILSGQGAAQITRGLRDHLAARIREKCVSQNRANSLPVPVEVLANYLAAVKLNMIIWWLDQGLPYTPEQMAAMVTRLVLDGAGGMLEAA